MPTTTGPIPRASTRPDDPPHASTTAAAAARRRHIRFGALAIAAYAVALVATIPASVLVPRGPVRAGTGGTIWNGEIGLAGGQRVAWAWAPLASLANLAFAADFRVTGGASDLAGRARLRPGAITLDTVTGAVDGGLLAAIAPNLPFTCAFVGQADFPAVRIGGAGTRAAGRMLTEGGSCTPVTPGAAPVALPPLAVVADTLGERTTLTVAPAGQRRRTLVAVRIAPDGGYTATLTPAGAAQLPFVGLPPGASVSGVF